MPYELHTSASLRREISARNLARAAGMEHEATYGTVPSVVYSGDGMMSHGNFLPASYRRICADEAWSKRLGKAYTASARVPRSGDRRRKELDCAASSDALLMNVFCYPRVLARPQLCALLGVVPNQRPEFGVRAHLAMRHTARKVPEADRTELDMTLGNLLFEAKLTETDFQTASLDRLLRYDGVQDIFDVSQLPASPRGIQGYQLVRGVLAAHASGGRFVLITDHRRAALEEMWFRVLCAITSYDLRSRMALLTWQEIAATLPAPLRSFLAAKYGIQATFSVPGPARRGYTGCEM